MLVVLLVDTKSELSTSIRVPIEVFKTLLHRGLGTWVEAPKELMRLSDILDAHANSDIIKS